MKLRTQDALALTILGTLTALSIIYMLVSSGC